MVVSLQPEFAYRSPSSETERQDRRASWSSTRQAVCGSNRTRHGADSQQVLASVVRLR